jgi:AraC-like DNA-binding protein
MDMRRKPAGTVTFNGVSRVKVLVQLAREHQVSEADCLSNSGITAASLADPLARISLEQEFAVIRNLQARLGSNTGLGLEAGLRYRSTTLGALGYALVSCATVRDALDLAIRYLNPLYGCLFLSAEEEGNELRFVVEDALAPADVRQFLVEQAIAATYSVTREVVGLPGAKLRIGQLTLRFPEPVCADRFAALGSRKLIFGAPRNSIVEDRAMLALPLPHYNEVAKDFCLAQHANQLSLDSCRESLKIFVRQFLLKCPGRIPSMEEMAACFAMTARTLRRRLEDEGTSYRELMGEILLDQADEMLRAGSSVDAVANRLGFSEAASFIRAYKRWTGGTPGRHRRP